MRVLPFIVLSHSPSVLYIYVSFLNPQNPGNSPLHSSPQRELKQHCQGQPVLNPEERKQDRQATGSIKQCWLYINQYVYIYIYKCIIYTHIHIYIYIYIYI